MAITRAVLKIGSNLVYANWFIHFTAGFLHSETSVLWS